MKVLDCLLIKTETVRTRLILLYEGLACVDEIELRGSLTEALLQWY